MGHRMTKKITADMAWRTNFKDGHTMNLAEGAVEVSFASNDNKGNRVYVYIVEGCKLQVLINGKRVTL